MSGTDTFRCPHCGQRHPGGTLYCPINGLPIELPDAAPALPGLPEIRKLNRWWLIGGAVLAGAILCLAGIVTLSILRERVNPNITPTVLVFLPSRANNTPAPNVTLVAATPQPGVTPLYEPWAACPDASYLSRLRIGDTAEVSSNPPLANRVRSQPSTDAEVVGSIQPGEDALVLDGPACANGWVWWKVRSNETGLEGWTAEGDSSNYWLAPVSQ
ncbi:MAG: SH3 domain-containing protein [Bellilinea sp.]